MSKNKKGSKETKKDASIAVVMGSKSDWPTMEHGVEILKKFGLNPEIKVVSAHRTPALLFEFANKAKARGIKVIIAGAGGAAHLPGMLASSTSLPVLGVPVQSAALSGLDSLLSIVQMPGGVPVPTFSIGKSGAINAALSAISILALSDSKLANALDKFRSDQTNSVLENSDPRK